MLISEKPVHSKQVDQQKDRDEGLLINSRIKDIYSINMFEKWDGISYKNKKCVYALRDFQRHFGWFTILC